MEDIGCSLLMVKAQGDVDQRKGFVIKSNAQRKLVFDNFTQGGPKHDKIAY
jgi:hypothetical protein